MNDNKTPEGPRLIDASKRFGKQEPPPEKLTPTFYQIHFKPKVIGEEEVVKTVFGYLGVSPLFVAITDEKEKILFMMPHSDYAFVEALIEDEIEVETEFDEGSESIEE